MLANTKSYNLSLRAPEGQEKNRDSCSEIMNHKFFYWPYGQLIQNCTGPTENLLATGQC